VTTAFVLLVAATTEHSHAWEGHVWEEWREVSTWRVPDLQTDQTGRHELIPALGEEGAISATLEDWEDRRAAYAGVIQAILGSPTDLTIPDPEAEDLGEEKLEGYTRKRIRIRAEQDDWIPAYVLIPNAPIASPAPAIVCLHQTVAQGKDEPCGIEGDPNLAFAVELVKRGFVCIAPDVIGFGERIPDGTQPYHDSLAFYRRHPNWSFMGKMIWDVSRVIDYLESLPYVDANQIGSIGHSHGAYSTLFAAAFEPRIRSAVASCGFTTFRKDPRPDRWSHLTALIPQLGHYLDEVSSIPFDWQHVLALTAPRRLFIWYATRDTIFPNTENLEILMEETRSIHELYGAEDAFEGHAFDGPHKFPRDAREKAYRWLEEMRADDERASPRR